MHEHVPHLLLWADRMSVENVYFLKQREMFTALGYAVEFRWKEGTKGRHWKPLSSQHALHVS